MTNGLVNATSFIEYTVCKVGSIIVNKEVPDLTFNYQLFSQSGSFINIQVIPHEMILPQFNATCPKC